MKPSNSKSDRSKCLLTVKSNQFDNYFDYYVFLHLNQVVILFHCIGMIVGFSFLGLAIANLSWVYLLLFFATLNGFPHMSHIYFDGIVSPATGETFGLSIFYAIKLNLIFLSGGYSRFEKRYCEKYPFVTNYYSKI